MEITEDNTPSERKGNDDARADERYPHVLDTVRLNGYLTLSQLKSVLEAQLFPADGVATAPDANEALADTEDSVDAVGSFLGQVVLVGSHNSSQHEALRDLQVGLHDIAYLLGRYIDGLPELTTSYYGNMTERPAAEPTVDIPAEQTPPEEGTEEVVDEDDNTELLQIVNSGYVTVNIDNDYHRLLKSKPKIKTAEAVALSKRIEAGVLAQERLELNQKLSEEEYKELLWLAGDGQEAKRYMIEHSLRIVVGVARGFLGRGVELMDLVQEGSIGLIRAIEKFDHKMEVAFSTYATNWIQREIRNAIYTKSRTISLTKDAAVASVNLNNARRQMLVDLGREPTTEELAKEMDVSPEKVDEIQKYSRMPISLNEPMNDEGGGEFGDLIEDSNGGTPEDVVIASSLREVLITELESIDIRHASMLLDLFGFDDGIQKTQTEVATKYGVKRQRVSQIVNKTLDKLRQPETIDTLRPFLGNQLD